MFIFFILRIYFRIVFIFIQKLYIDKYVWGDDLMENFNDLKNLYEDGYRCIYQDGNEEKHEKFVCPECGNESIIPTGGCAICLQCGYSKCN